MLGDLLPTAWTTAMSQDFWSLTEACVHAERQGPGYVVYHPADLKVYRICVAGREPLRSVLVYRTLPRASRKQLVYNHGRWNERHSMGD